MSGSILLKKPDIITMVRLHQNNLSLPETTSDAFKQIGFEHPLFDIWIQQAPSHWQRVLGSAEIDLQHSWHECTPQAYNKQLHIFWTQYGHLAQQFANTDPLLFARILNVAIRNTHLLFTFDKWRPEYDKVKIRQFFQTAAAKDSDPHNELKMILGKTPDVLKNLFHRLDENELFEFVKLFLKEGDALQFALRELILILRATSNIERYCLIVRSISKAVHKRTNTYWEFSDLLAQAPFVADNCEDVGRLCDSIGLSYLAQERKKVALGWAGGGSAASAKLSFFEAFAPLHQYFSSNTDRFSEKPVSKDLIDRTRHFAKFIIHVFRESSTPFDVEIPGARTLTSISRTTRYLDCFTALKQWYESNPDKTQFKAFLKDVYLPRLKESKTPYYSTLKEQVQDQIVSRLKTEPCDVDAFEREIFGGKPESFRAVPVPAPVVASAPPLSFAVAGEGSEEVGTVVKKGEILEKTCDNKPVPERVISSGCEDASVVKKPSSKEELQLLVAGLSEENAALILKLVQELRAAQRVAEIMGGGVYATTGLSHHRTPHPADPRLLP
jgi:hypothetical protein